MGAGDFMENRTTWVISDAICSLSEDFDRDRSFPDLLFSCGLVTRRWQALDSTFKSFKDIAPKVNYCYLKYGDQGSEMMGCLQKPTHLKYFFFYHSFGNCFQSCYLVPRAKIVYGSTTIFKDIIICSFL